MQVIILPEAMDDPKGFEPQSNLGSGTFADVPDNGAEAWTACDAAYSWMQATLSEEAHIYERESGTKLAYMQRTIYE